MAHDDLLRVTKIKVTNLFDRYSHEVELHLRDRVTIIHGPNGVGKTVLLKLTSGLLQGRIADFAKIPFRSFEVHLSDGSSLGAVTAVQTALPLPSHLYFRPATGPEQTYEVRADLSHIAALAGQIESQANWLGRVGPDQYLDRRTNQSLSALDVVFQFSSILPPQLRKDPFLNPPPWIESISKRVVIHFVETQRLLRPAPQRDEYRYYYPGAPSPGGTQYVETVKDYAKDLQDRISRAVTTYARQSQALDQSFPVRLLSPDASPTAAIDDLKIRMRELEQKRERLKRIGLVAEDYAYPFDVNKLEEATTAQQSVMTLYVDDTAQKLGVFDSLARRIEIMLDIINKKFQHKSIRMSRDRGIAAFTPEGKQLELEALSSGEQHELVLLYDLLFKVSANTLVLIDEPELSLHVTWQKEFMPDLLQIASAANLDVLLATHSPFIVGDRTDLMVELRTDGRQA